MMICQSLLVRFARNNMRENNRYLDKTEATPWKYAVKAVLSLVLEEFSSQNEDQCLKNYYPCKGDVMDSISFWEVVILKANNLDNVLWILLFVNSVH